MMLRILLVILITGGVLWGTRYFTAGPEAVTAEISRDGQLIQKLLLKKGDPPKEFTVEFRGGFNRLMTEDGGIAAAIDQTASGGVVGVYDALDVEVGIDSAVYAACTHGVFSGPAIDRLKNSAIAKVVTTNTLPLPPEKQIDKIEVLSVAGIIADAIDAVFEDTSVSEIFGGANQS